MAPAAKSDFLKKFENRISVVGRDGQVTKVGGAEDVIDSSSNASLFPVDDSTEEMGAITRMHPALADALLGGVSASIDAPRASFGIPSPQRSGQGQRSSAGALGSFGPPPGQQTVVQPPPANGGGARRTIKNKPSISELQVRAQHQQQPTLAFFVPSQAALALCSASSSWDLYMRLSSHRCRALPSVCGDSRRRSRSRRACALASPVAATATPRPRPLLHRLRSAAWATPRSAPSPPPRPMAWRGAGAAGASQLRTTSRRRSSRRATAIKRSPRLIRPRRTRTLQSPAWLTTALSLTIRTRRVAMAAAVTVAWPLFWRPTTCRQATVRQQTALAATCQTASAAICPGP